MQAAQSSPLRLFDGNCGDYITLADIAHYIHARGDIAKDGVIRRQAGLIFQADEKLAAIGVGTSIGHRHGPGFIRAFNSFVLELVAGAPSAGSGGVAALNDETGHHPVEGDVVIETITGQGHEVIHRHGCFSRVQLEVNIAFVGLNGGGIRSIRLNLHCRRRAVALR